VQLPLSLGVAAPALPRGCVHACACPRLRSCSRTSACALRRLYPRSRRGGGAARPDARRACRSRTIASPRSTHVRVSMSRGDCVFGESTVSRPAIRMLRILSFNIFSSVCTIAEDLYHPLTVGWPGHSYADETVYNAPFDEDLRVRLRVYYHHYPRLARRRSHLDHQGR
jgi:hypothetical protein